MTAEAGPFFGAVGVLVGVSTNMALNLPEWVALPLAILGVMVMTYIGVHLTH